MKETEVDLPVDKERKAASIMLALPITSFTEALCIHATHKAHANDTNAGFRHDSLASSNSTLNRTSRWRVFHSETRLSHDGIQGQVSDNSSNVFHELVIVSRMIRWEGQS